MLQNKKQYNTITAMLCDCVLKHIMYSIVKTVCKIGRSNVLHAVANEKNNNIMVRVQVVTPMHFLYYFINYCRDLNSLYDAWNSIRVYFDCLLDNFQQKNSIAFSWILCILNQILIKLGHKIMTQKHGKKDFLHLVKRTLLTLCDISVDFTTIESQSNSATDATLLPPTLFIGQPRSNSNDENQPGPQWLQRDYYASIFEHLQSRENLSHQFHAQWNAYGKRGYLFIPIVFLCKIEPFLVSLRLLASQSMHILYLSHKQDWSVPHFMSNIGMMRMNRRNANQFAISKYRLNIDSVMNAPSTPRTNTTFEVDKSSISNILSSMFANKLSQILKPNNESKSINHGFDFTLNAASTFLSSLCVAKYNFTVNSFKKECWNHFMSDDFFLCSVSSLHHWQTVIIRILDHDKSLFKYELLSAASTNVFSKYETQIKQRSNQLKRLSFVIHGGRNDQFGRYLHGILEKLVEALKSPDAPELHIQVFACLRVLLTRVDVTNLSAIWPLIITQTIRVFETQMTNKDLLLAVCKFIDTALVLLPHHFQLFKWLYVQNETIPQTTSSNDSTLNQFTIFLPQLQLLSNKIIKSKNNADEESMQKNNINTNSRYGDGFSKDNTKRRPVLLMRSIQSIHELLPFHRIVSSVDQKRSQITEVDDMFMDQLIRSDFVESDEFVNPCF